MRTRRDRASALTAHWDSGEPLPGIKCWLRRFFPGYSIREARAGTVCDAPPPRDRAKRGRLIHAQIEALARGDTLAHVMPETQRVLDELEKHKLELVGSEVMVSDPVLGFRTPVDIVARRADGRLVLIELKTSWNRACFFKSSGRVRAPLDAVLDDSSGASQAIAQILAAQLSLYVRHGTLCDAEVLLLMMPSRTKWLRLPGKRGDAEVRALYAALAKTRRRVVKKKTVKRKGKK
jgi:hypothetical protein